MVRCQEGMVGIATVAWYLYEAVDGLQLIGCVFAEITLTNS